MSQALSHRKVVTELANRPRSRQDKNRRKPSQSRSTRPTLRVKRSILTSGAPFEICLPSRAMPQTPMKSEKFRLKEDFATVIARVDEVRERLLRI